MHFLSREIILHVCCRWWCFLRPFRRNKGQIFQPIAEAWHRNEALNSAFWFGTYRFHRYRCHVGTGFRYPTLRMTRIHCSGAGNKHIWPLPTQNRMWHQASSRPLWVIACYLEIRRVMLVSCPWKYNWLNRINAGLRSRGGSNLDRDLLTINCAALVVSVQLV